MDLKKLNHQPELFITHLKPGDETMIVEELAGLMPERSPKQLMIGEIFEL